MDDVVRKLEAEYALHIDLSLLNAILGDFDLSKDDELQSARVTLDAIKATAEVESATGFDPSGTGSFDRAPESERISGSSPEETSEAASRTTDQTSLSNGFTSLDLEGEDDVPQNLPGVELLDGMDDEQKIDTLLECFQPHNVTRTRVRFVLSKCKGNVQAAMDELLTQMYFEDPANAENGFQMPAKGVDGFAESPASRRSRKGKSKARAAKQSDGRISVSLPISSAQSRSANKWQTSQQDVEFLVKRLSLPSALVTSTYHHNGASLPRTIDALLKSDLSKLVQFRKDDPTIVANAADLQKEFPSLPPGALLTLICLTHPSTSAAHEVVKEMFTKPAAGGIEFIPKYEPVSLDSDEEIEVGGPSSAYALAPDGTSLAGSSGAGNQLTQYAADRDRLRAQASAAYRKSKSNRLMGGAAAYYSQESRDKEALRMQENASAMDRLAASQSTALEVDLHGIDVVNAVRIAKGYVSHWWASLGENRVNGRVGVEERRTGYRIIVGRGTHSEGGKGKLMPAVSSMLRAGGWKFEPAGAVITVTGRSKK